MSALACEMKAVGGEQVALVDVDVKARLRDLLAEVSVTQMYRNDEQTNIEAVYTFPLPMDAVLMDLVVDIAGRKLRGVVVEKSSAERQYEEALEKGDSAVMLQEVEPGLYTMNLGNLMPGEAASITFSYSLLYRWSGDSLRLLLPTSVAPRYGQWGHQPHQEPEHSFSVENHFGLNLTIEGRLAGAQFHCPSHDVTVTRGEGLLDISFRQERAVMDRDFILEIKAPPGERGFALSGEDGQGAAVLASFQPFFPGLRQRRTMNLSIVVDCSGSMSGDSMQQAKAALQEICNALRPDDQASIIAFGSTVTALSRKLMACSPGNLGKLRKFARELDADMGGTEIGAAMEAAFKQLKRQKEGDIFLITDGEVHRWQAVVERSHELGHRVFTVGVGSAVSESFLRELADRTGGHCELVSPREGMSERVVRHFERIRAPRASEVRVLWPEGAVDVAPRELGAVFEGDTVVSSARFDEAVVDGQVEVEVHTDDGEVFRQWVDIAPAAFDETEEPSTVARLAAAMRLDGADEESGRAIALNYRLISPWTHWLVIHERAEGEQATEMPDLRKVPQTVAAGWHGMGSVHSADFMDADFDDTALYSMNSMVMRESVAQMSVSAERVNRQESAAPPSRSGQDGLIERIERLGETFTPKRALRLLKSIGLQGEWREALDLATRAGISVESAAVLLLARLLDGVDMDELNESVAEFCWRTESAAAKLMLAIHELVESIRQLEKAMTPKDSLKLLDARVTAGEELIERSRMLQAFQVRLELLPSAWVRLQRDSGRFDDLRSFLDID